MRAALVCTFIALLPAACARTPKVIIIERPPSESAESPAQAPPGQAIPGQVFEVRSVSDFDRLSVGGVFVVTVEVGPRPHVEIRGDDGIVPDVRTEVNGQTLDIRLPGSHVTDHPLSVTITTPSLRGVDVSDSASVTIRGIQGERFEVELSGSSAAELSGETSTLVAMSHGSTTLRAQELVAEIVEADAEGASTIEVHATRSIEGDLSGASTLRYRGGATSISLTTNGSSTVESTR